MSDKIHIDFEMDKEDLAHAMYMLNQLYWDNYDGQWDITDRQHKAIEELFDKINECQKGVEK